MTTPHGLTFTMATLGSPDPPALARFYARLLGGRSGLRSPGGLRCVTPLAGFAWASTSKTSTPRPYGRPGLANN